MITLLTFSVSTINLASVVLAYKALQLGADFTLFGSLQGASAQQALHRENVFTKHVYRVWTGMVLQTGGGTT